MVWMSISLAYAGITKHHGRMHSLSRHGTQLQLALIVKGWASLAKRTPALALADCMARNQGCFPKPQTLTSHPLEHAGIDGLIAVALVAGNLGRRAGCAVDVQMRLCASAVEGPAGIAQGQGAGWALQVC